MISGYYEFLLETILLTSQNFEDIIEDIDDEVASDFLSLINKDIKTQYNALDITNSGDNISFMADNQFITKVKSGINPLDLFLDTNNKSSSGRIVRKILKDNGKEYNELQISTFVDKFKASYQKFKSKKEKKDPIRLVSGEEIRFWYLEDNYCIKTTRGWGTLGKSCMRYDYCQSHLDIYVNNPEVCRLLILTDVIDGSEKLLARALVWTTDNGYFIDRVYHTDGSESNILSNWAKDNLNGENLNTSRKKTVQLRNDIGMYDEYPYMDTMSYYCVSDRKLYNYEPEVDNRKELLFLEDTSGGYERMDLIYCDYTDSSYPSDEVVHSAYHNSYLPRNRTEWSEYHDSYLYDDESVYSETLEDYLGKYSSAEVIIDESDNVDWFPKNSDMIAYDRSCNKYYLRKLMVDIGGGDWYYKDNVIKYVIITGDSIKKYREIFNIELNVESVLSEVCANFYKLDNEFDISEWIVKSTYYERVYMYVNYQEMYDKLELIKGADNVIEELEQANSTLLKGKNAYKYRNWVFSIGVDKLLYLYKNSLNNKTNDKTRFDISFDSALSNYGKLYIDEPKLKSEVRKIIENDLFEFSSGCTNIGWNVKFDMSKLSKFVNIFKKEFPTYVTDEHIERLLRVVVITIYFTTHNQGYYLHRDEEKLYSTILYFINNPNKLPVT